jgi:L-seryl-tRNA(Ser) seleniumtransferase
MLTEPASVVGERAERLRAALADAGVDGDLRDAPAVVGGGSWPGTELPSVAVRVAVDGADAVATRLRLGDPAVVARVQDGAVWLDARTVGDDEVGPLARAVASALRGE